MSETKRIPIEEFQELGFLQEANRQFFHPHGLALEIVVEGDGTRRLGGVWDYREDPEGLVFGSAGYGDSVERAERVRAERMRHAQHRYRLFHGDGVVEIDEQEDVEPLDWAYPDGGA